MIFLKDLSKNEFISKLNKISHIPPSTYTKFQTKIVNTVPLEEDEADVDDFAVVAVVDDGLEVVVDDPAGRITNFTLWFHSYALVFGAQI